MNNFLPNPNSVVNEMAEQAQVIRAQLEEWAEPRGGTVKVLANMFHLWEELLVVSDAPRVLICFVSDSNRGDSQISSRTHRVDRTWNVVVVRGHGFKNGVADKVGNQDPFLWAMAQVRDQCRVLLNISMEFPVEYKSMRPMPQLADSRQANVFLDAYVIEFTTANDLPDIVLEQPGQ